MSGQRQGCNTLELAKPGVLPRKYNCCELGVWEKGRTRVTRRADTHRERPYVPAAPSGPRPDPGRGAHGGQTPAPAGHLRQQDAVRACIGQPAVRGLRQQDVGAGRVSGTAARACISGTSARGLRQRAVGAGLARSPRRRRRCCVLVAWAVSWLHHTVLLHFGVAPPGLSARGAPANSACPPCGFPKHAPG